MARRIHFVFLTAVLLLAAVIAVWANERASVDARPALPFEPAEELVYEGEFSRALLRGVDIAELRFTVEQLPTGPSKQTGDEEDAGKLRFKAEVLSKGFLQKLFRLSFRQQIESTVEAKTFSVLSTTKLDEQDERVRISEAVFDHKTGKVVWTERDPNNPNRQPRVVTSDLSGTVQDIASAVYFLRTQKLVPGQSLEITLSDSGKVYKVPVRVSEKKEMKTVLGKVSTVQVDAEVFGKERLLDGPGSLSIWFTDDARRVPVKAHITNEYGEMDIKLKKMSKAAPDKLG